MGPGSSQSGKWFAAGIHVVLKGKKDSLYSKVVLGLREEFGRKGGRGRI